MQLTHSFTQQLIHAPYAYSFLLIPCGTALKTGRVQNARGVKKKLLNPGVQVQLSYKARRVHSRAK